jgi:hypothetical protein
MTAKIYVLAWGSLIWDPRELKMEGDWQKGGPVLPIEFSRKSMRGNLSLVIDEKNGVEIPVRYCKSGCASLDEALDNLRIREEAKTPVNMGYIDFVGVRDSERAVRNHPNAVETIRTWCANKDWSAVIWTALPPNFPEQGSFSPELARRHLESLQGNIRDRAFEYVRKAPEEVNTPVRRLVADLVASK